MVRRRRRTIHTHDLRMILCFMIYALQYFFCNSRLLAVKETRFPTSTSSFSFHLFSFPPRSVRDGAPTFESKSGTSPGVEAEQAAESEEAGEAGDGQPRLPPPSSDTRAVTVRPSSAHTVLLRRAARPNASRLSSCPRPRPRGRDDDDDDDEEKAGEEEAAPSVGHGRSRLVTRGHFNIRAIAPLFINKYD